jgi:hypothetical protein
LELGFETIEDLLEGFPWDARVALRISGYSSRNGPKLRVLSCGYEEVDGVHGFFAWNTS